jgi:hypothetical protein
VSLSAPIAYPPMDAPASYQPDFQLEEESLRDNFVIAYELLDEVGLSSCAASICACAACMLPAVQALYKLCQRFLCSQVMDYGYPQFTEAKILSEYIKTDAYRMAVGV